MIPRWAKALLLALVVGGGGLGLILWTRGAAARCRKESAAVAVDRQVAWPKTRPVLRGTAEPGNAWTDYALAAQEVADPKLQYQLNLLKQNDYKDNTHSILESLPHALEHLARGARREAGRYDGDWKKGPPANYQCSNALGTVAVAKARLLRDEGRVREALDLLTDLLQFAGDVRRNSGVGGDMVGSGLTTLAIWELADLIPKLEDTSELARRLAIFDASWADSTLALRETAPDYRAAIERERVGPLKAWNYGFSVDAMKADAVLTLERLIEESIRIESFPWKEGLAERSRLDREVSESSNRALRRVFGVAPRCAFNCRLARAHLRILRMTVDRNLPELDDPFGTKLRRDGNKVWSVGSDGVDNGGKGEWRKYQEKGDLVLDQS